MRIRKKRDKKRVFRLILCGFRGIVHNVIFYERNKDGLMTGKTNKDLSLVLPLNARTARTASGGGLAASLHEFPAKKNRVQGGYHIGFEPDEQDIIAQTAADSCIASSLSTPRPSNQHLI